MSEAIQKRTGEALSRRGFLRGALGVGLAVATVGVGAAQAATAPLRSSPCPTLIRDEVDLWAPPAQDILTDLRKLAAKIRDAPPPEPHTWHLNRSQIREIMEPTRAASGMPREAFYGPGVVRGVLSV